MRPDFILKNVMVYQTFRQCFEKRDVAVAGEKFYCVSPAISYPGVREIDGKGRYMLPGLVDIHMHIESSMTYPGEFSRITLPYGVTTVVADGERVRHGRHPGFYGPEDEAGHFLGDSVQCTGDK